MGEDELGKETEGNECFSSGVFSFYWRKKCGFFRYSFPEEIFKFFLWSTVISHFFFSCGHAQTHEVKLCLELVSTYVWQYIIFLQLSVSPFVFVSVKNIKEQHARASHSWRQVTVLLYTDHWKRSSLQSKSTSLS